MLSQAEIAELPDDLASLPRHRRMSDDAAVALAKRAVPFDFVSVSGFDLGSYKVGNFNSVTSSFPPAFVEAYAGEKLFLDDPMVLAGKDGAGVVTEDSLAGHYEMPQRLAYLLRTFRISRRIAFFLRRGGHNYGSVVFAREGAPFGADEAEYLGMIAPPLHERVTRPLVDRFGPQIVGLLDGEVECIRLAGQGMTSEEIAAASRFTRETVDSYLKSATRKLQARNRAHAIAIAIRHRLID
ncbi:MULTISPECIES: LuxR C-terminal-related transcriptional regulator [Rhizobium/Agrobacterium group]|uniref:helix-turn-helix transcriptional regulator n=1 Tax=Rhizobium/Agrobacterium group TaxID=227290 RepID=UPI001ADC11F0|nr:MULTISPECIES: LuxR C-terminal-related transcriptional regulator [Rhizobium/Agrobacterium group]MBO9111765.1 autoinducer binding domain-containing protein [Agrobacterium sp. S2/73]QXZ76694.1 autoinducer binding domain-containing protein [Agrobacterium sp. S7/73]QYA17140.1 autoinducer binding domain-containing protein [Rhizobium sp. AB2/73]UEQ85287.1 autoinducer binding domain-containing protein [Rhizobium sp. AB2/73]